MKSFYFFHKGNEIGVRISEKRFCGSQSDWLTEYGHLRATNDARLHLVKIVGTGLCMGN
jgi:hypothetical protein